ncbi:hypothetical protein [Paracoccus sp. SSK6]|uniref:hypothetical protein n=1 Tax=Paracoccus sp. SSK6 TaxID=3143131 RepID=UPI00321AD07C
MPDLSTDKSGRACLPLGRRVTAPAQSGAAGLQMSGLVARPLPCALRLWAIGPGECPLDIHLPDLWLYTAEEWLVGAAI